MKRLLLIMFFISSMVFLTLFSQEKITEEVKIEWWVLPLFAVDKNGNSILDLEKSDIDLRVNNEKITEFTLYKRAFSVETSAVKPGKKEIPTHLKKSKIVFLLFDNAFTTITNYNQTKEIAKNLVLKAEENTLFSVIAVDPLLGPVYIGGPLADKQKIVNLIDEKIRWDLNTKSIRLVILLGASTQMMGKGAGKKGEPKGLRLDPQEVAYLTEQRSSGLRTANKLYYRSFQTLSHALNSIKDNKFVYLFSEGISLFARSVLTAGQEEYWHFMKQTAGYLDRTGAVLFIINPAGDILSSKNIASGEDSLRYLAQESGGKYIEGEEKVIVEQIDNFSHAYYEIAFPDQGSFKGSIRNVTISSRRTGVKIHTLRKLEKTRQYSDMKDIEKEILVLNLLNPSPLFESPLKTRALEITKKSEKKDEILYKVDLPQDFRGENIDVFKIRLDKSTNDAKVEKETLVSSNRSLKIAFKRSEKAVTRIVLVNEKAKTALVQGIFDTEAKKKSILAISAAEFMKKVKQMSAGEIKELNRVKRGLADYCAKLNEAAFHYICKETVHEVLKVISTVPKGVLETDENSIYNLYQMDTRSKVVRRKLTNQYINDYQLISNKGQVKEQRKLLKGTIKKIGGKDDLLKLDSFITRKISLTPISLLGSENQAGFYYRFVKFDKLKGVKTAVIECFPKDTSNIKSIYGKIWIDLADFSVMRMRVNPVSIGGYNELLKRAKAYKANLTLSCQINFYKKRSGIRFPTQVFIREVYSGGIAFRTLLGKSSWERSKTTYTFDDYQFFDVAATTKEEEIKK